MNLYGFELGRKRKLCLAELHAVLGDNNFVEEIGNIGVFKLGTPPDQNLQNKLGGTIKIIHITQNLLQDQETFEINKAIETIINKHFTDHEGKIPFAISAYNFQRREIDIRKLLSFSKKIIKSLGFNCRFVNKAFNSPKPSTIYKAKVIEKGIDLNIIKGKKYIYIGKSLAIQDIDSYSKRDYDKPKRDARVGMLPPKLSQIMINLAGDAETIFDPFCGTGTILMEALLMGKNAVGSDLADKLVNYSQENCKWLKEEFNTPGVFRIFQRDARFLTPKCLPEEIDAIITEGYLGEPRSKYPSEQDREKTFRELANLHLNWLTAVNKILKPGAKIVMCVAAIKDAKKIHYFPRFNEIAESAGFQVMEKYLYERPDQIVVRDITILKKS